MGKWQSKEMGKMGSNIRGGSSQGGGGGGGAWASHKREEKDLKRKWGGDPSKKATEAWEPNCRATGKTNSLVRFNGKKSPELRGNNLRKIR